MAFSDKHKLKELKDENLRLRQAVDELTLLNELATASAGTGDLSEVLKNIIKKSMQAVRAEQGVITLIDETQDNELRTLVRTSLTSGTDDAFRPNDQVLGWMHLNLKPLTINSPNDDERFPQTKWDPAIRSILSVPLITKGKLIGVLTLYNKLNPEGFQPGDQRLLIIIAAQSAQIVTNARLSDERAHVIQLFGQHTSPAIVEQLLKADPDTTGERKHVCIMFLDIRGFTSFSERRMPEEVVAYLNQLFDIAVGIVNEAGGIIHQLLGDGFMAIFGAPISHGNDSWLAVDASLKIIQRVREECDAGRLTETRLGIGLHAGEVVAGSVGTAIHKEYKVTGDVVNLAARIEGLNKTYDSQLLVSDAIIADIVSTDRDSTGRASEGQISEKNDAENFSIGFQAEEIGEVDVRGRDRPVRLFRLA